MNYEDSLKEVKFQKSEIGNMKWVSYSECVKIIRPYNIEKIKIIKIVNNILNNNIII